jgi:methionyl-tRNA formyltransferase
LLDIYSEQVIALRAKSEYSTVFPLDFDIPNFLELDLPIELSLVVSQPDSNNRGKITPNPVTNWARVNNLNLFIPESFNKSRSELTSEIDIAITASFGQIISEDSLSWPKNGFVNWHPSLLPKYRGATPMQSAIKNGDKESGLSWINMTKGLDEGDIFLQFNTNIEQGNFATLSQRLGELGSRTWAIAIVNKLIGKKLKQVESKITFCGKLAKEDRIIDPQNQTASEIYNQFRAYSTFPGTSFIDEYFGEEIKLVECNITTVSKTDLDKDLDVAKATLNNWLVTKSNKKQIVYLICKDQTLLEVTKIKLATGKDQTLSGYQFKTK